MFYSSKSVYVLQFMTSGSPGHTYSTPEGSSSNIMAIYSRCTADYGKIMIVSDWIYLNNNLKLSSS